MRIAVYAETSFPDGSTECRFVIVGHEGAGPCVLRFPPGRTRKCRLSAGESYEIGPGYPIEA